MEGGREVAGREKALLLLILAFALIQQLLFATTPDAAFVTFRYADNIAAGHGAVYNLGERVEGPANFLWLVLVTLPKALFGVGVAQGAMVLSTACVLGCVLVVHRLGGRYGLLAAALTAGVGGWAAAGLAGTELDLFVLLLLATAYALSTGHPVVTGVLAALAVMTRPEGLFFAAAALCWLAVGAARGQRSWWAPAACLLGGLVFVVPWLVWRATYYDQSLVSRPMVAVTASSYGFLLAALLAVVIARVCASRVRPSPTPRRRPFLVAAITLTVCAVSLPISAASWSGVAQRRSRVAEAMEIGSWLADRLPLGSVIGTGGSSVLAYAVGARLVVVDDYLTTRPPVLIGYQATLDCTGYQGGYESATFRWDGSGTWVTVFPRDDLFSRLVDRLAADPRLTYVPCPEPPAG